MMILSETQFWEEKYGMETCETLAGYGKRLPVLKQSHLFCSPGLFSLPSESRNPSHWIISPEKNFLGRRIMQSVRTVKYIHAKYARESSYILAILLYVLSTLEVFKASFILQLSEMQHAV
jgi:hypothetical protein